MEDFGNSPSPSEDRPPLDGTFGAQLEWHLAWGTRPEGKPDKRGVLWRPGDFAHAIGRVERNISNWITKGTRPGDLKKIEDVLFGENTLYEVWQNALRVAYNKLPKLRRNPESSHGEGFLFSVPSRLADFVGRDDQLEELSRILLDDCDKPNLAIIFGLGGMGKSSLAAEYCYREQNEYAGIWWISSASRGDALAGILRLGRYLKIAPAVDESDLELSASLCVQALSKVTDRWLLVFDNVERPGDLEGCMPSGNVHTLVTSRFAHWARSKVIPLEDLSEESSVALLHSIACWEDELGATRLSLVLGGLPLALTQAAATCRVMQITFSEYAERADNLLKVAPHNPNYPTDVFVTFELAIRHAVKKTPAAAGLMSFLAQCSPEPIPKQLLTLSRVHEVEESSALLMLLELSLVRLDQFEDGASALKVHRLVQSVARTRAEENGSRVHAIQRLVNALLARFPLQDFLTSSTALWPECEKYIAHVHALQNRISEDEVFLEADIVLDAGALYQGTRERLVLSEVLARAAIRQASRLARDMEHHFVINERLGIILKKRHSLEEALETFIKLKEMAYADRHRKPSLLFSVHNNIAEIYRDFGEYDKAGLEYQFASQFEDPTSSAEKLTTLSNLAELKMAQFEFEHASSLIKQSIAILKETYHSKHWKIADAMYNLAVCEINLDNKQNAVGLLHQAASILESEFGLRHARTCKALEKLGLALSSAHSKLNWHSYFLKALEGLRALRGDNHPSVAVCLNSFGDALTSHHDYGRANEQFRNALSIMEPLHSDHHHITLPILSNLADSYLDLKMPEEACPYLQRTVAACKASFGPTHARTGHSTLKYSSVLEYLGLYSQAIELLSALEQSCAEEFDQDDPRLIQIAQECRRLRLEYQRRA